MKLNKDQLEAVKQQEDKILNHLNAIKSKLQETKSLTGEYASKLDRHMNAYWKHTSGSQMHPHVKSAIGILIQSIKTIIKRKTNG